MLISLCNGSRTCRTSSTQASCPRPSSPGCWPRAAPRCRARCWPPVSCPARRCCGGCRRTNLSTHFRADPAPYLQPPDCHAVIISHAHQSKLLIYRSWMHCFRWCQARHAGVRAKLAVEYLEGEGVAKSACASGVSEEAYLSSRACMLAGWWSLACRMHAAPDLLCCAATLQLPVYIINRNERTHWHTAQRGIMIKQ